MSWVKLNIKCPHCGSGSQSAWYHTGCGGYMSINSNARVECSSGHGYPFMTWKWKCGGNHAYEKANKLYAKAALGELMAQLMKCGQISNAMVINKAIGVILQSM
eukprot:UN07844